MFKNIYFFKTLYLPVLISLNIISQYLLIYTKNKKRNKKKISKLRCIIGFDFIVKFDLAKTVKKKEKFLFVRHVHTFYLLDDSGAVISKEKLDVFQFLS